MTEQNLHVVMAHIDDNPQFAQNVANDARVSGRNWDSQTLRRFMTMRQTILHLTADEIDSAIGHATHRRDHPLTAEERRTRRNPPRPEGPCADKRRAVDAAWLQVHVVDPTLSTLGLAGTATTVTAAAQQPSSDSQAAVIVGAVVTGIAGGLVLANQFVEHIKAYRRALAELETCLCRNNLRAEAERLRTTIAAIDAEVTQLQNRARMA